MKILSVVLFFLTGVCVYSQTILDKQTQKPIEGLEVVSGEQSAITDENGNFSLAIEPESKVQIIIDADSEIVIRGSDFKNGIYYLDLNKIQLETVVISPLRWKVSKNDIGNKTVSFSPSTVELNNPRTMADLLGTSNDVFIQMSQLGGGSPMIRGFAANRVMITVDGVRMNNAIFRSGNLQNVISLDANSIESSEVLFGPGSLMYGSDAIGGTMNFYTLTPKFSTADKIEVSGMGMLRYASAAQENTSHINFNISGKKFSSLTSFTYSDFSDLLMGKHGPDEYLRRHFVVRQGNEDVMIDNPNQRKQVETGYKQYNLVQKFRYKPNQNWDLNYGIHYSTTSNIPRYDRLLIYKGDHLKFAEWYYGTQKWIMNNLMIENSAEINFYTKAKLILAYQHFEESRHDRNFGKTNQSNQNEKVDVFSLNLDLFKIFNPKNIFYYGVETLFNKVNSVANELNIVTGETSPAATRYPNGSTWDSYAAYVSHEYKPNTEVTVQGGLRYSYVNSHSKFTNEFFDFQFDHATIKTGNLVGNLGVNYHPTHKTTARMMFSTGYRAPNIDDIGKIFDSGKDGVIVPNPNLKGEYAYSAEAGLVQKLGNFAKIDVAAYYIDLKNAMVKRDFQLNGQDSIIYDGDYAQVQAIQNAAKAFSYGLETTLEIYLNRQLTFLNALNLQRGKEELDNGDKAPLRHVAPLMVQSSLVYKVNRFRAEFNFLYNGKFSFDQLAPSEQEKDYMYAIGKDGKPYLPSWYTLNLLAVYDLYQNVSVSAGWENITNQRYRAYSSGIVAPASNLILAVRLNF